MWNKASPPFLGCDADFDDAEIVLFGAPFDSTASYRPGSRFGSRAMREESFGLETYSPVLDADLSDCRVFDAGDPELCIGDAERALAEIGRISGEILDAGKLPVMLGGEHLVTLAAVREAVKCYPDLCMIHFDAHTDLRADYLGARLSHATVLRRCWELLGDGRIYQFGIRSGLREEFRWAENHTILHPYNFAGLKQAVEAIGGRPVYLTVDLDVLDPSIFPGTGTPEPDGVSFRELAAAAELAASDCHVVGCDLVELAPVLDQSGVSTIVACKLLRELLLTLSAARKNQCKIGRTGS